MQPPTTVLIADDHPILLEGLVALFQAAQHSVVAQCRSGAEVLAALERVAPEVVVLDLNMPAPNGLDVVRQLKQAEHPAKIVLLTSNLDDGQIIEAMRLGVDGIVLKESAPQQLIAALEAVRAGQSWFDSDVANRAVNKALSLQTSRIATDLLTRRELDVARLVARGLRNKVIARELGLTEGTVKFYLHKIYDKLGIDSRTALANALRDSDLL